MADSAQMVRFCDAVEHDADKLPGKSVGLRFELKDADLYWLQFLFMLARQMSPRSR